MPRQASARHALVAILVVAALPAPPLAAQIRASERASVSQTIDGTTMTIEYGRPRLRQRAPGEIYGKQVYWGEVWTPGANAATTFSVDRDITINGTHVPAGSYSVWMVVRDTSSWNTVLIADTTLFHLPNPTVTDDMLQFMSPVTPTAAPVVDLTWSFRDIGSTGVVAEMAWADRKATWQVAVEPSLPIDFPEEKARAFVGNYAVSWADGPAPGTFDGTMEIYWADGALRDRWTVWFWEEMTEQILVPLTDEWFTFGMAVDGEMFDVIREFTFEFAFEDGKATGFEVRMPDDSILFRGTRVD
jgi:hypothetical protein